jgi:hypothetical protein
MYPGFEAEGDADVVVAEDKGTGLQDKLSRREHKFFSSFLGILST